MKSKPMIDEAWDNIFKKYSENNFSNHAFPLYLFTERLYQELVQNNCNDVLFMSREGQFLKKLFERYCEIRKECGHEVKNIKTHYFLGSRNSIMTASVKPLKEETFDFMFRFFKYFISPKMFMFSIGFTDKQIEEVEKTFGKKINRHCLNFKTSSTFKKLKTNPTFIKFYEENRQKQSTAFEKYMSGFNLDYKKDGLTFVDIGYHGTMQDLIFKFFNQEIKTHGYFIKSRATQSENNTKMGLLSDNAKKDLLGSKVTKYDSFNYEQILRADHGRCLGYEIINDDTAIALIDEKHGDVEVYEKYIKKMQNEIFDKFELIAKKCLTENCNSALICTIYFYYLVKNKTKQDFKWIMDMQDSHHDDFGYVGYPARAFARSLRKLVFTVKDKLFVLRNRGYINKLKKELLKK
ncbi:MAG: hypothetical protein IJ295_00640 [Clostridia bacterium]|nr:hypothetical protein [Clostridia bacterium]